MPLLLRLSHSPDFLCVVAVTALAAVVNVVPLLSAVKDYIDKVLQALLLLLVKKRVSYNVITPANPFCPTADIISPYCGGRPRHALHCQTN